MVQQYILVPQAPFKVELDNLKKKLVNEKRLQRGNKHCNTASPLRGTISIQYETMKIMNTQNIVSELISHSSGDCGACVTSN